MTTKRQQVGFAHEQLAVSYLKQCGYRIIEQNYQTKTGEIDIIAKDNNTLVFVEVKSRRSHRFGSAKYAVTRNKQKKITRTAQWYLKQTGQFHQKARFDVVAIDAVKNPPAVELIQNAFESAYG